MPNTSHRSAVTAFAAEPTSATAARRFVRQTLTSAGIGDGICDRAELIVSELVTNAVLHAGTGPVVSVRIDERRVRIAVEDTSPVAPVLREYGLDAVTGRGLRVVSNAASEWGVETTSSGKAVWAILETDGSQTDGSEPRLPQLSYKNTVAPRSPNALDALAKEPTYRVSFVDIPLKTYAQLESHNESLIREFSLLNIQLNGDEEHHMPAALREAITMAAKNDVRFTLLRIGARAAQRDHQTAFSMDLQMTSTMADQLERYAEWAEQADELSRQKLLLTAPPPDGVQLLREWLVREAVAQVRGGSPATSSTTTSKPTSSTIQAE